MPARIFAVPFFLFVLALLSFFGCTQIIQQTDAALANNGVSAYVIVLPSDAIPAEKTAAEELQNYLEQMTSAKLPIITEDQYDGSADQKMFAVGFNQKLPADLKADKFGAFAADEILITPSGDTLLLAGGRPRGTLYAVYEYLHRLGVRWYTPEATHVPTIKTLELPKEQYRFNPPVFARTQAAGNNPTQEWSIRNRLNALTIWTTPSEKYGGGYGQGPDMHTFMRMLPVALLKDHPDWMAMIDGKREQVVGTTWGLCLTNPEVRKIIIDRTMDWARKNPDRTGVWVGQNDGSKPCECDTCKTFYAQHGDQPSSVMVLLINEFADVLEKEFPNRMAKTLAYSWSLEPPENMTIRDNVMIMFCPFSTFAIPIEKNPETLRIRTAIDNWRKIAKNLDVYLYSAPWDNYWFVEPCTYSGAENIRWAFRNGMSSIFTAISGFGATYGSDSVHLRAWVYARLCWDPSQDTQALIDDFCRGYYGPAGDTVIAAQKLIDTDVLNPDNTLRIYNESTIVPHHLNPASIRKVNLMYEKAYNGMTDPAYKKRLSMEWIAYLWTDFWLGFTGPGRYEPSGKTWAVPMQDSKLRAKYGDLVRQFMIDNKINVLKERRNLNPYRLSLGKMGVQWPASELRAKTLRTVVVPGVGGKITEFRDTRSDFLPIKPYWGLLITEYPLIGSWRDLVNFEQVTAYTENKNKASIQTAELIGKAGGCNIVKQVTVNAEENADPAMTVTLTATSTKEQKIEIRSAMMLDLGDKAFGKYPTVYIEKTDGTWSQRVLGSETTFWYIAGTLDIKDATGRIVIASEKRPEGLLLTIDPAKTSTINFEYDRYSHWAAEDQANMVFIEPTRTIDSASVGESVDLPIKLRILLDAKAEVEKMKQSARR